MTSKRLMPTPPPRRPRPPHAAPPARPPEPPAPPAHPGGPRARRPEPPGGPDARPHDAPSRPARPYARPPDEPLAHSAGRYARPHDPPARAGGPAGRPQEPPFRSPGRRPAPGAPPPRGGHRLGKPPVTPQVTTLWDYPSQHYGEREQGSQAYRGATPSYVIWNVVHRFTEPGALVVDPFCGSGTTLDVCADLDRKALGFDLAPTRPDIAQADARSLPLKQGKVDLVFMDPPYADNLEYSDDARCIGKLKADGRYQRAMRLALAESARVLREGGVLAIYVCDVFQKGRGFFPLGFELFAAARELLRPVDVVSVVRHNRTLEMGNYRRAADEGDFFLRGFNYLLLFRKASRAAAEAPPPDHDGA